MRSTLAYLAAGAISTIAVAAACMVLFTFEYAAFQKSYSHADEPRWIVRTFEVLGRTSLESVALRPSNKNPEFQIRPRYWSRVTDRPSEEDQNRPPYPALDVTSRHEAAIGWPFRAFVGWRDVRNHSRDFRGGANKTTTAFEPQWAVETLRTPPSNWNSVDPAASLLPLCPILLGFALNTFLFAILWFAVILSFKHRIAQGRLAKGKCPRCRYDITALKSERCSECGTLLNDPKQRWRDRFFYMVLAPFWLFVAGAITSVGLAWGSAFWSAPMPVNMEYGWCEPNESAWILGREDDAFATRLLWLFDDDFANLGRRQRQLERMTSAEGRNRSQDTVEVRDRADSEMQERLRVLARRQQLPSYSAMQPPAWSDRIEESTGPDRYESSMEVACGWPLRCLRSAALVRADLERFIRNPQSVQPEGFIDALIARKQKGWVDPRMLVVLPLRPIWPGLIFNTLSFAAVWTALILLARVLRRKVIASGTRESASASPS